MNDAVEYGALHTLSPALFGGEGTGSATGLGFLTVSKIQVVLTSIYLTHCLILFIEMKEVK